VHPAYGGRGRVPTLPSRAAVASVAAVVSSLGDEAWQALCVGQGANGPLVSEFAAVRVWAVRHGQAGPPIWLLVRRSLEPTPEIKYYVSDAEASTPLGVLARVACTRHEVEEYFGDAKSYLGMAQYETRSWVGWHHHMSLVGMAHLFITLTRRDLKKETPEVDLGPYGSTDAEGDGDPGVVAEDSDQVGGVPHRPQRDCHEITHQDMDGKTRGGQIPRAGGVGEPLPSCGGLLETRPGVRGSARGPGRMIGQSDRLYEIIT